MKKHKKSFVEYVRHEAELETEKEAEKFANELISHAEDLLTVMDAINNMNIGFTVFMYKECHSGDLVMQVARNAGKHDQWLIFKEYFDYLPFENVDQIDAWAEEMESLSARVRITDYTDVGGKKTQIIIDQEI